MKTRVDIDGARSMTHPPSIVTLNVGGKIFQTTRSTLLNPIAKQSFFTAMFIGEYAVEEQIFLDRSPAKFAFILEYLRNGKPDATPAGLYTESLIDEAVYFFLDELADTLRARRQQELSDANFGINVGEVSNLSPGSSAFVRNVGTSKNAILEFGIPSGRDGFCGPQGPPGRPYHSHGPQGERVIARGAQGSPYD